MAAFVTRTHPLSFTGEIGIDNALVMETKEEVRARICWMTQDNVGISMQHLSPLIASITTEHVQPLLHCAAVSISCQVLPNCSHRHLNRTTSNAQSLT